MAKKVTTHTFELKGKDNASKVIGKVKRSTESFGDSMFKVTGILSNSINIVKGVSNVIGAMGRVVTGSIGSTVESFAKFEKGMAEVATITDLSKAEIAGFGVELQELSSKYALDATDATKALYQTISAGIPAENAIDVFTESAKFAKTALVDTSTAVDLITTVLNSYQAEASDAGRASDILFALIEKGKTNGEELAGSLGRVTSLAYGAGVSFEDLAGALAVMTQAGLATDEATTSLRAVIQSVVNPTNDAQQAIDDLGLTMFNQGALAEKGGLFRAIQQVSDASEGSIAKLSAVIPNIRALVGAMAIGGAQEKIPDILNDITESAGKTETGLAKMMDTFFFKQERLESQWDILKATLGEVLASHPVLQKAMDDLSGTMDALMVGIREGTGEWGFLKDEINDIVNNALPTLRKGFDDTAKTIKEAGGFIDSIRDSVEWMGKAWRLMKAISPSEIASNSFRAVAGVMADTADTSEVLANELENQADKWDELRKPVEEMGIPLQNQIRLAGESASGLNVLAVSLLNVVQPLVDVYNSFKDVGEGAEEATKKVGVLTGKLMEPITGEGDASGATLKQLRREVYQYNDALKSIPTAYSTWSPVITKVMKSIKDLPISEQIAELERLKSALSGMWAQAGGGKAVEDIARIGGHISEAVKVGMDKGSEEGGLLAEQNFSNTARSMGNSMATSFATMFQSNALDPEFNLGDAWRDFGDTASMNLTKALSDPFIGAGSPMETFFTGAMDMATEFSAGMMEDISNYFTEKFAMQETDQAVQIASNATTSQTITAQNVASANASGASWIGPATMASIATLGSALAMGLLVQVVVRKAMTWFADGGFVNEPTMGMVGEEGREVIIPLTKPTIARGLLGEVYDSYPNLFGMKTNRGESEAMSSVGKTNNINITVNVDSGNSPHATGWTIANMVDKLLAQKMQGAYK